MKKILLTLLCTLLPLLGWAQENEPYAVLSDNNTVLTFYYDDQRAERNGISIPLWYYEWDSVTTVVFDVSFAACTTLTSTAYWFYGFGNLVTISSIENLNTSNVTDMGSMFYGCSSLTSLDLSSFNTSNVTDMSSMFRGCSSLSSLDLSSFNTSNVTDMGSMFYGCSGLTSLDLSSFNTGNVTSMGSMFYGCSGLTSLDLSSFNTGKVTDMGYMFYGCSGLTSLDLNSFNTSNVTNMSFVFSSCSGLTTIYVGEGWNTAATRGFEMFRNSSRLVGGKGTKYDKAHVDYIYARIDQGPDSDAPGYFTRSGDAPWAEPELSVEAYAALSDNNTVLTFYYDDQKAKRKGMSIGPFDLDYQSWAAQRKAITTVVFDASFAACTTLTSTSYWFFGCSNLITISGIGNINTSNVTDMSYMFYDCRVLTSLDLSGFNTSNVTDMESLFEGCPSLISLDLSGFVTSNVTNMDGMFDECSSLVNLDLSGFDTSNVTDMDGMFAGSSSLMRLDLSSFNTSNVTNMRAMFEECSSLTSLDLSSFNTSNVTDMSEMFADCSSLISLDLSSFNTSNVTDMSWMFYGCSSLTSLDLSSFNTSNVADMSEMFTGSSSLMTISVGEEWNTAAVTRDYEMFGDCLSLVGGMGTKYDAAHTYHTYARIDQGPDSDAPGYFTRGVDAPLVEPTTEAYAALSDGNTVLTFYYDDQKAERNGMSVGPFLNFEEREWSDNCEKITSVVFDLSFANDSTITSTAYWFDGFKNLKVITGMENLNTSNVTDMSYMFGDCWSLNNLNLSNFNTANVTNMKGMFCACESLTTLDLSSFNTENVTDMNGMFSGCSSLTSLDVNSFSTANVTDMNQMFRHCNVLTSLDVSNFNTSNITDMGGMFQGCNSLTSLDVSNFNTSNVTDMGGMFQGCNSFTCLDLSNFNTFNVTNMTRMFAGSDGLRTIYVGEGWGTAVINTDYLGSEMFQGCFSLVGGMGTKYDDIHEHYTYARIDQGPDSDAPGYFTRSGDIPWGERATFDGRVLTVRGSGSIDAALAQVGGLEQVDKTITAIVWEADVPYSGEAAFSNPNLLFYANDATKGQAINNLIYNGVAESITLTDEGEGNTDFYCPQSFTARSITYKRSFLQQTEIGVSRGWETIALPFTVQRISRVRSGGEGRDNITPFGSSESTRHFWLRRLTANGLQSVQTIEANTPYIIAMPNSEEYAAEYNLAGDIVFTAENAAVAVTEPVSDRSTDYELTASFERMAAQDSIYVLNVGAPRYGYPEGSLFEAAYRDLQPFRAYTRHINSGRPAPPYFALGNLGGTTTTGISSVSDDAFATDVWYDIQGRKLQGRPTQKGVYIHNGRKVIVK